MAKRKQKGQEQAIRPGLLYAGIAILVAVVAFAVVNFVFLGGGGGEPEESPAPTAAPQPPGGAAPAPSPTAAPSQPSAEQIGLFEGRNPFVPVAGAAPVPPPTPTPEPTPVPTPTPAPQAQGGQPSEDAVYVEVVSVAEDGSSASIRVGEELFERAKPRDVLARGFVVDRIEDSCVFMHRERDSFRLCAGERVLK